MFPSGSTCGSVKMGVIEGQHVLEHPDYPLCEEDRQKKEAHIQKWHDRVVSKLLREE
jgi:hypothetical protein